MNERIEELSKEAWRQIDIGKIRGRHRAYTKIFAELMVKECVKVMYDNAIERKVPRDITQTPTHYAVAVLEHFGVKE